MKSCVRAPYNVTTMITTNDISSSSALPVSSAASKVQSSKEMFQSILSMMMVSSLDGGDSESGSSMMAPMMAMLLENLVALQVRESDSSEAETGSTAIASAAKSAAAGISGVSLGGETPAGLPVQGGHLTQGYHSSHNGLDIGVPTGTPVTSTMNGKVIYSGWNNQGYGNLVIVEAGAYRTYYAHLSDAPLAVGTQVQAGQVIGSSGSTGNSTGPHLHYEIRLNQQNIDPTALTL
jgi:hypothetical protein